MLVPKVSFYQIYTYKQKTLSYYNPCVTSYVSMLSHCSFADGYHVVCVQNPVRPTGLVEQMAKGHTK